MYKGNSWGGDKGNRKDFVRKNEQIRITPVLVIYNGQNLGTMPTRDALAKAKDYNLDLVEIVPNRRPPVCHIMDYGKYLFDKKRKEKENQKNHRPKEKEVGFRYVISDHDLQTKANQIRGFLEKGMKVRCVVTFKQREKAHKDQGFVVLERLFKLLTDVAVVEKQAAFEGSNVTARLDLRKDYKKDVSKEADDSVE